MLTPPSPSLSSSSTPRVSRFFEDDSPGVLATRSPDLSVREASRRSVHVGDKLVNWARPIKSEKESGGSLYSGQSSCIVRLFGASSQRNRRVNRLQPPISPPSSPDEGPLTPTPILSLNECEIPSHSWSVTSKGTGLGVFGIAEWDTPLIAHEESYTKQPELLSIELASPSLESVDTTPKVPSVQSRRIQYNAESLGTLGSPTTLSELRRLRQAAVELQNEAQRPMKPAAPKEKAIKRKAVPKILVSDIAESSACVYIDATPASPKRTFASRRRPRPSTVYQLSSTAEVATPEISPRIGSLPFQIPARQTSRLETHPMSRISSESDDTPESEGSTVRSRSETSSISDQLGTPPLDATFCRDGIVGGLLVGVEDGLENLSLAAEMDKRFEFDLQSKGEVRKGLSRILNW